MEPMSEKRPSEVLSALPRTRPHRRSDKRAGKPEAEGNGAPKEAAEAKAPAKRAASTAGKPAKAKTPTTTAKKAPAKKAPAKAPATRATPPQPTAVTPPEPAAQAPPRSARPPRARPKHHSERLRQPPQPAGTPPKPRSRKPVPATGADIVGTAVQAAAELAEIGLTVSARALRNAVSKLPKP
jgi:hypothetical protein